MKLSPTTERDYFWGRMASKIIIFVGIVFIFGVFALPPVFVYQKATKDCEIIAERNRGKLSFLEVGERTEWKNRKERDPWSVPYRIRWHRETKKTGTISVMSLGPDRSLSHDDITIHLKSVSVEDPLIVTIRTAQEIAEEEQRRLEMGEKSDPSPSKYSTFYDLLNDNSSPDS